MIRRADYSRSPQIYYPYSYPGYTYYPGYSYYSYPYYAPFTLVPSFIYSYRPYRYRYPYDHNYHGYRPAPLPRVWVRPPVLRPGGVHPYRPSMTPPPPRPNNNQPHGQPSPPRGSQSPHR